MPEYPVIEYTRKHLLVAKDGLRRTAGSTSLNNFGLVYQDFRTEEFPRQICYGALSYDRGINSPHTPNNPCVLFYDRPGFKPGINKDLQKTYLTWLLNESIFRHAFITKKWHIAQKFGVIYSTQYPLQYVVQAGKAVRYMGERPEVIVRWNKLAPHMNKNAALFLAHFLAESYHDSFLFSTVTLGGHYMFDAPHFGCRGLKRVVEEDFSAFKELSLARKVAGYKGQGLIWGELAAREQYKPISLPQHAAKLINRQDLFGQPIQLQVFRWKDLPETGPLIVQHNLEQVADAA